MKRLGTVAVVGVGMIGGSIGQALIERNLAKNVVGVGRSQASLRSARRVGAITNTTIDLNRGVADAELVFVCTPVAAVVETVKQAAEHCPERTLISDVCGLKRAVVGPLDDGLARGCRFLGGHPLVEGGQNGVLDARADLFDGRIVILTPTVNTRAEDFDFLADFWQALGAVVVKMPPEEHDRAVAMTEHLPYLSAAAMSAALPEKLFRLAGGGVSAATRQAAGDPSLWADALTLNRDNVLTALEQYGSQLAAAHAAIRDGRRDALLDILTLAKKHRDALGD
ncbi:MAG: prephenate dehydrogenase [Pirellulales bacterium]|nr:prephenate dehydrogenase [Pirellulales bacterium]